MGWREPSGRRRYRAAKIREQAEALRLEIERTGSLAASSPTLAECISCMLREQRREIRPLTTEGIEVLAVGADLRYRVPILLAGYLGLRAGEIGGVRLLDVDFERGTLQIVRATRREGGRRVLGEVKTAAGRRRITVPSSLVEEIRRHIDSYPPADDGWIFTAPQGALLVNILLWQALARSARRVGVSRPRFHDLRHSTAALMIAHRAHPKIIQVRLVDSNIRVTLDVYGHLFPTVDGSLPRRMSRHGGRPSGRNSISLRYRGNTPILERSRPSGPTRIMSSSSPCLRRRHDCKGRCLDV